MKAKKITSSLLSFLFSRSQDVIKMKNKKYRYWKPKDISLDIMRAYEIPQLKPAKLNNVISNGLKTPKL